MGVKENLQKLALKEGVKVVAVTKTFPPQKIVEAIQAGITDVGENYVQEAQKKFEIIGRKVKWHFLGHLQRNKVKKAVQIFDMIQSVDSYNLAKEINNQSQKIGKIMEVLVQADTSGDKHGLSVEETLSFVKKICEDFRNIKVLGLMTIAPFDNPRPAFKKMKKLFDESGLKILSMGMTNSYKIAIGEGSNMVRIGTAIFGERL